MLKIQSLIPPFNTWRKISKITLLIASKQKSTDLARSRLDDNINQTGCYCFKLDWKLHHFEICTDKKEGGGAFVKCSAFKTKLKTFIHDIMHVSHQNWSLKSVKFISINLSNEVEKLFLYFCPSNFHQFVNETTLL